VDANPRNNQPTKIMKPIKSFAVAMAGLALSAVTSHAQLTLNYASTPGSTIQFNGAASSFQFNSSTLVLPAPIGAFYVGSQWSIGSEVGGTGSALGLLGVINNGPFIYGPITSPSIGDEIANVAGPLGALSINDGLGYLLTGNVNWIQMETDNSLGGINASLNVNVTGLAYAGTNPDLAALVAGGPGSMNVSFQFSPSEMLSQLTSGSGSYNTSFSGSISVPEPMSTGVLLLGLGVLVCFQRFTQNRRS
jgi:hypothetical protein